MLNVALTGNIAAGKSTVLQWFAEWGATVIDADALVREAQRPGTPTLAAIRQHFGDGVIAADGALDRAALRQKVLEDMRALAALNGIVHPAVSARRAELIAEAAARGERMVINDIPLLFEALDPAEFDTVILVDAPIELRRERLIRDRQLSGKQANQMIAAQMSAEGKRSRSDVVIDNDGTLDTLRDKAEEVWKHLLDLAEAAG
jgi:dephospho-CoA kinase